VAGVEGKIVFITGAGSEIRRVTSRVLAKGGADVALCDINLVAAEEVAGEVVSASRRAVALVMVGDSLAGSLAFQGISRGVVSGSPRPPPTLFPA
jgi:NAD(P)-dependent dehydrogenase (short-subunit alcohol dehydrogenase family)